MEMVSLSDSLHKMTNLCLEKNKKKKKIFQSVVFWMFYSNGKR